MTILHRVALGMFALGLGVNLLLRRLYQQGVSETLVVWGVIIAEIICALAIVSVFLYWAFWLFAKLTDKIIKPEQADDE